MPAEPTDDLPARLRALLAIVRPGVEYGAEHFPASAQPGKFVGHTPAEEHEAALLALIDAAGEAADRVEQDAARLRDAFAEQWRQACEWQRSEDALQAELAALRARVEQDAAAPDLDALDRVADWLRRDHAYTLAAVVDETCAYIARKSGLPT